jgi:release factor glutamine methyltransferase
MCSPDSSIASLLSDLEARLQSHTDTPRLDAQVLMAHILDRPRPWLLTHLEQQLTPQQFGQFAQAASRLEGGEPLPYIIGYWEFYGLDFMVTPQVLIPRPETELLVEHALDWLRSHPARLLVADIGTGSGCIAITLAVNLPDLRLLASDISLPALEVAKSNAQNHNVANRIQFIQADLLEFPPIAPIDLLCANLPYIPTASLPPLAVSKYEPVLALDGGNNGLQLIQKLLLRTHTHLASDGLILLEIEASQGCFAQNLAQNLFKDAQIQVIPDLAGHDRLLRIQLSDNQ